MTGELGEMAGGATGLALGVQLRQQEIDIAYDSVSRDGGFGFAPQVYTDWSSSRETEAVFAELVIFPAENLELDFAARYEDTDGQSSTEPKITGLWTPTDDLFVRFSAGSSFRLASERQMFGVGAAPTSIRPLGGEVTQARTTALGNPLLEPEESDNWTAGFTWDATDDLTFDFTVWNYDFTNLVSTINPDEILVADSADGFINDPRIRLFGGRPTEVCEVTGRWDDSRDAEGNYINPLPDGCITGFDIQLYVTSFTNRDSVETSGFDFSVDWRRPLLNGDFGVRLLSSYVTKFDISAADGSIVDAAGSDAGEDLGLFNNPELRANVITTFDSGNHSVRWSARYTSGIELYNPGAFEYNTSEGGWTQHDVVYTYTLPSSNEVTLAILNITDNEPPLMANTLTTEDSRLYDPRGRMFRLVYSHSF